PLEAGIPPQFEVMDGRDAAEALARAQETVIAEAHSGTDTALQDALATVTGRVHETNFAALMAELAADRAKLRRMLARHGGLEGAVTALRKVLGVGPEDTSDGLLAAACSEAAFEVAGLKLACAAL